MAPIQDEKERDIAELHGGENAAPAATSGAQHEGSPPEEEEVKFEENEVLEEETKEKEAPEQGPFIPGPDQDLTKEPRYDVHRAAAKGDIEEIRRLAAAGADLNVAAVTEGSFVPLDVAATTQPKAALELLRLGADPSLCGSAVVAAASWGHEELLRELLKGGGNPGQKMGTATALRWAVQRCNEECALLLFEAGAWDAEDEDGERAEDQEALLMRAVSRGMRRLVARIAEEHPDFVKDFDLRSTWQVWSDRLQRFKGAMCRSRQRTAEGSPSRPPSAAKAAE